MLGVCNADISSFGCQVQWLVGSYVIGFNMLHTVIVCLSNYCFSVEFEGIYLVFPVSDSDAK